MNLIGYVSGRLTVLTKGTKHPDRHQYWVCECSCGTLKEIGQKRLRNGESRSCGCLARELTVKRRTTHGHARSVHHKATKEYTAWLNMKKRCYNPSHEQYKDYGGRGIKVCTAWLISFDAFLRDVGKAPSIDLTLDRKDNEGDYEPSNVHWATRVFQRANRRDGICLRSL